MTTIPLEQICDFITAQSLYRPLLDFWVEIKKNCYWNCCPGPANGLVQPIGRHLLSCQHPLITYLGIFLTWTSLSKLQSATRWASFNLIITISSINSSKAYPFFSQIMVPKTISGKCFVTFFLFFMIQKSCTCILHLYSSKLTPHFSTQNGRNTNKCQKLGYNVHRHFHTL